MKDRVSKFKNGKMLPKDIFDFKENVDSMTDEELDKFLNDCESDLTFTNSDIDSLQNRLNEEIKTERRNLIIHRFYKICASIMLPAILLCGILLINCYIDLEHYESMVSQDITIQTDNGESIMTILPDGSKITMGPKSMLSYNIGTFNDDNRQICFSGEGNFSIRRKIEAPFKLLVSNIEIKVLGTVFSLYSRENDKATEVFLEEGSLQLTSLISDCNELLSPGETAIINNGTGKIEIIDDTSDYKRTAGRSIIYFKSTPLSDIAKDLKLYYGKDIKVNNDAKDILFTGSLPTNDFEQVIFVLENTLNISIVQDSTDGSLTATKDSDRKSNGRLFP